MATLLLNFSSSLHSGFRFGLNRHKIATGATRLGDRGSLPDHNWPPFPLSDMDTPRERWRLPKH
ncbi:hypothetical protein [Bradyrhizobium neotropicale]|uniref:hypothetical protein n=1 Tax=Bradyrhizobium neotropicale TaxID=1497615 RepID=UPI0007C5BFCA|nr:hypothetical protein [Bradyrhizobium neotropicale]